MTTRGRTAPIAIVQPEPWPMPATRMLKVPREVTLLDELPRNATGKVMRRQLMP